MLTDSIKRIKSRLDELDDVELAIVASYLDWLGQYMEINDPTNPHFKDAFYLDNG